MGILKMPKPYCIGSEEWNGLSKLIEELGELQQVCGKLIGGEGNVDHWSGDLKEKFIEELGDVYAALDYFMDKNFTSSETNSIFARSDKKYLLFKQWDKDVHNASEN